MFSTLSHVPKWSHSTLKTNIVWRTQKLIHSISQCFSMALPFVRSGVSSPQCQKILKGSVQRNSVHQVVLYLSG